MGDKLLLKLNMDGRPIANKYCEGKMKRTLKKGLKDLKSLKSKGSSRCFVCTCECRERRDGTAVRYWLDAYLRNSTCACRCTQKTKWGQAAGIKCAVARSRERHAKAAAGPEG